MGWVGVALSLVGGIMGAQGQRQEGQDINAAEEYNAGVLRANAEAIRLSNRYDLYGLEKSKQRFLSTQQALYAKSGVSTSEGSPLEVMIDTATQFEMEKMLSKYNAQTQAAQLENEANQRIKLGRKAIISGNNKATQTLLSTAGSAAGSYGGGGKGLTGGAGAIGGSRAGFYSGTSGVGSTVGARLG